MLGVIVPGPSVCYSCGHGKEASHMGQPGGRMACHDRRLDFIVTALPGRLAMDATHRPTYLAWPLNGRQTPDLP
jgi:hypothetical protein